MQKKFATKTIVEGGLLVALSFVLGQIKLFHMPQGGSVTLGLMIPIFIFALRHGVYPGIIAGVVLGLLKLAIGGYVVGFWQVFLDYPVAFGMLGLAGLFSKKFKETKSITPVLEGALVGTLGRFVAAVLSGVIFFADYAGDQNPWVYSMTYNITYLGVELVIAILVIYLLRSFIIRDLSKENF
ncbi:MAG: energy-coupled thiamine transporter ThiT [Ezakiella sp.]|nr:energy-coupled thiamine transporter ThiT [Ezakiella sp.]MDD7472448.1 energy-coupled thiamine transporter ThiT [Bacillota bacterium]MDY3923181.1 energy-coupled thiamine transporter ThiT [Ezakiella sp.]